LITPVALPLAAAAGDDGAAGADAADGVGDGTGGATDADGEAAGVPLELQAATMSARPRSGTYRRRDHMC
jgi:hypothetical protein